MGIDPAELDKLIERSGVSAKEAEKLREANSSPPPSPGHGAPAAATRLRGSL